MRPNTISESVLLQIFITGKPSPHRSLIEPAIQPLATLLRRNVGDEVVVDALWALSYLADGDNDRIEMVMSHGITNDLVQRLAGDNTALLTPLVRTLGNFVTGTDEQTQRVVDAGVLEHMTKLVQHQNVSFTTSKISGAN